MRIADRIFIAGDPHLIQSALQVLVENGLGGLHPASAVAIALTAGDGDDAGRAVLAVTYEGGQLSLSELSDALSAEPAALSETSELAAERSRLHLVKQYAEEMCAAVRAEERDGVYGVVLRFPLLPDDALSRP